MTEAEMKSLLISVESKELTRDEEKNIPGEFVDLPSGRTHFEVRGEGSAVVLVHGYATPYYIYDKLFENFIKAGYRVLRYDLLGRGYSERVRADYTPELFARQLDEISAHVFGAEPFYLVGTSMGGTITAAFTSLHPDRVKKLVLLAPAGMDTFEPPMYMKLCKIPVLGSFIFKNVAGKMLLKRAASELYHVPESENDYYTRSFAAAAAYKGFLDCTLSSLRHTILETKAATDRYKVVGESGLPVLCIWGTADKTMPYYQHERLLRVVPQVELITYEGSGHIFLFDEGDRTASDILDFFKK